METADAISRRYASLPRNHFGSVSTEIASAPASSYSFAVKLAAEIIDSGKAAETLEKFIALSNDFGRRRFLTLADKGNTRFPQCFLKSKVSLFHR